MSQRESLTPFRIAPEFVERIWGWNDLHPWYNFKTKGGPVGEVWLTGDQCHVDGGRLNGERLDAVFAAHAEALLGAGAEAASPLLLKVIFARQKLSVQVHPDDQMAHKYGQPRGKTECWYVLAAEPGAEVACGLKPGVTLDQVKRGIADGTLEESLERVQVEPGEMIFVDAGTVHAIWPGSVLLETQQNCDLTYRMYDYGRGRELHVEKSLEAVKFTTKAGRVAPQQLAGRTILLDAKYFRVEQVEVDRSIGSAALQGADTPRLAYLFAAAGTARIAGAGFVPVELTRGGIVAVPASSPEFVLEDLGELKLIRVSVRSGR